MANEFSLVMGPPATTEEHASLELALEGMRRRFADENFTGMLRFDEAELLRNERCWYVPYHWIGCSGFIVNRDNGYVNWLGSGISLSDCFWGHERGIVCDRVDFTFTRPTQPDEAVLFPLVRSFMHRATNNAGLEDEMWEYFDDTTALAAIRAHYPVFQDHVVWRALPTLRAAVLSGVVSFEARLA